MKPRLPLLRALKNGIESLRRKRQAYRDAWLIDRHVRAGCEPWSVGYDAYRWSRITEAIRDATLKRMVRAGELPSRFGYRIDERIVEYLWALAHMDSGAGTLLDAGSALNHPTLLQHAKLRDKSVTVMTAAPEAHCSWRDGVSYQFGDLRSLPFRSDLFDVVVSISTLEHIGMDNSIYGWSEEKAAPDGEVAHELQLDYLDALGEIVRVLRPGGVLLLTFPYGRFENHGFFQQFDADMLARLEARLGLCGSVDKKFFRYVDDGWSPATSAECDDLVSFNPHTGAGKGHDGAAHSRSVCCVRFDHTMPGGSAAPKAGRSTGEKGSGKAAGHTIDSRVQTC